MTTPAFIPVAAVADIAPGSATPRTVGGTAILICHSDGEFFAVSAQCSHADEPLACGMVRNGWISCPAHGARFDLATGEPLNPPASAPIRTFPVRITDGMIEVAV